MSEGISMAKKQRNRLEEQFNECMEELYMRKLPVQ
jgi:hypothetical protein